MPRFLYGFERYRTFLAQALRELGDFTIQFRSWHCSSDKSDPFRILRRHHLSSESIVEPVLGLQMLGQNSRGVAGREMAEVDLRETEERVFRRNRDVAAGGYRERAAKTPARDASDDRLRQGAQHLVAPAPDFFSYRVSHLCRLVFHFKGILLQILAGAKILAGAGQNNHP